ncbi:MAG: condensation domain-containing protein [Candidatus Bathyarchaeia archaeon]
MADCCTPASRLEGENTEGSAGEVRMRLGREATEILLHTLPANCRVRPTEAMLTALYLTLSHWTGSDVVCVDIEGHGREEFVEGIDLTRTVGWFTSIYPVLLKLDPEVEGGIIGSVKERLRRIPHNGFGYGVLRYLTEHHLGMEQTAEISFNYFGQFDQHFNDYSLFRPVPKGFGSTVGAANPRAYLIDVNCSVLGGELEAVWTYSRNIHHCETIERLARGFLDRLESLIYECVSLDTDYSSISDFPLVTMDWRLLSELLRKRPEIQEVLPLLPAQEEMLMHTKPGSDVYLMQIRWQLEGALELAVLQRAWHEVLERHHLLQNAFIRDFGGLQIVLAPVAPLWQEYDLRSDPDPTATIARICEQDRHRGFDLAYAPLTRFLLFRTAQRRYELVWSFPHLLMDGWSTSVVLAEVRRNYEAAIRGKTFQPEPTFYARDYAYWFRTQDSAEQENFWRTELSAYTRSGAFDLKQDGRASAEGYYGLSSRLETRYTTALNALAKQWQLTLGTLVQAAWALLLALYGKRNEVIFGLTFSGRTVPVRGIESMVGLFINTLPVYVQLNPEESLLELFVRIREQQLRLSQYEYTPAELIRRAAGADELFSSVLRFQNYPKDFLLKQESRSLEWCEVECYDIWHYPLSLSAIPDYEMLLWLTYSCGHFRQESVEEIMQTLKHVLRMIADDPSRSVLSLLEDGRMV